MTLYRAQVMDTPDDPFRGGTLRADADAGLLVVDGVIVERGPYADVRRAHHTETVVDLSSGLLLPGFVDTPMLAPTIADPTTRQALEDSVPLRRLARPEDIGRVVRFLLSDDAAYVHGAAIVVDGGMTAVGGQR